MAKETYIRFRCNSKDKLKIEQNAAASNMNVTDFLIQLGTTSVIETKTKIIKEND